MKSKQGFTLIELLIVIGISILLVSAVIVSINSTLRSSRANALSKEERLVAEQVMRYYTYTGNVPQSMEEFYDFLKNKDYFPTTPQNPLYTHNTDTPERGWQFSSNTFTDHIVCTIKSFDGHYPYRFTIYRTLGSDPTSVYINKFNGKPYGGSDD